MSEFKCDNGPTMNKKEIYVLEKEKHLFTGDGRRVSNWKDIIWQAWAAGSLEQGDTAQYCLFSTASFKQETENSGGPIMLFWNHYFQTENLKQWANIAFFETTSLKQKVGNVLPFLEQLN